MRNRHSVQWLAFVGLNIVLAALLLYALNWLGARNGIHLPINIATISTIGVLGIPGLFLLVALKATLIGFG
jgi:inhibitor of the pro-sigma K processing machinery